MPLNPPSLYFDFVDPLSYLVEISLRDLEAEGGAPVELIGLELRPPPAPLTDASDPFWSGRWDRARRASPNALGAPPALVPWTRKAHELHVWAAGREAQRDVRRRVFDAFFREGRDIGRVDELVEIAGAAGLDRTEAKAALDVDKHEHDVLDARRAAGDHGVSDLPALLVSGTVVEGFHNLTDLSTLLGGPPAGGR